MRHHIVLLSVISLFSLNGFAYTWNKVEPNLLKSTIENTYYTGEYKHGLQKDSTTCNFQKIPSSQLETIVLDAVKAGHATPSGPSGGGTIFSLNMAGEGYNNFVRPKVHALCTSYAAFGKNSTTTNTANNNSGSAGNNNSGSDNSQVPAILTNTAVTAYGAYQQGTGSATKNETQFTTSGGSDKKPAAVDSTNSCGLSGCPSAQQQTTTTSQSTGLPTAGSTQAMTSIDGKSDIFTTTASDGSKSVLTKNLETGESTIQNFKADGTPIDKPTKLNSDVADLKNSGKSAGLGNDSINALDKTNSEELSKEEAQKAKELEDANTRDYEALVQQAETLQKSVTAACTNPEFVYPDCAEMTTQAGLIVTKTAAASAKHKICMGSASKANFLCPMATSPQAQIAGVVMNGLAAILPSMSSAAKTCKATSTVNLIGQSVLGTGLIVCGGAKMICDTSCAATDASLKLIATSITKLNTSLIAASGAASSEAMTTTNTDKRTALQTVVSELKTANTSAVEIASGTTPKQAAVTKTIGECAQHKVNIAQMGTTMANMGAAAAQAKACSDKLASETGGNGGSGTTVAELCAIPANANSTVCKCRLNNTAEGCPGYISANLGGNINKDTSIKGISQMAGTKFGLKSSGGLGSLSGSDLDLNTDEAKKALAANTDKAPDSGFGAAATASSGGGGGVGSGSGSGSAAAKVKEEPKSLAGSFMSAIGSFFKGSGAKTAEKEKLDKSKADQYKSAQRQLASEQLRSEVSSASGMDNWTKVKTRYKSNYSSLISE